MPACLFLIVTIALSAQATTTGEQPRIGLVLGGGGARGVAHIGVIKVLEEMRIPIACVAGTSMGSLIGGVYAAGVPVDEITAALRDINWEQLFDDDPPRTEIPFHAKRDDHQNLFRLELGQRGTEILLPPGTTEGYKFEFLLRRLVARAGNFADQDFDRLPIPYRAVATNLENGTSKVFSDGDLVKAMRASMSVPGVIAPVQIDGTLYVDGGLLQNIPVAAARDACADVVIVVNVGAGLLARDELNSVFGVTLQMLNLMMAQNVRASIESLGPQDVLIEPELGSFSSADFAGALPLIELGERAARAKLEKLHQYSVSDRRYLAWRQSVTARLPLTPPVDEVKVVTGGDRVNPVVIEQELAEVPGVDLRRHPETDFSLENLNKRLEQIYGRGDFERVDYRMLDRQGTRTVEVEGIEKSWGPNYLKFGLGLASDSNETRFDVSASHRSTWLNTLGAEWRNDLQVGYRDRVVSEFHQPLSLKAGAFVAPRIDLKEEPIVLYVDGRRAGDYRVSYARAHLDFGTQNKYGELRIGTFAGTLEAEEDFGLITGVPDYDVTQVGYTARLVFDQIDSLHFGRDGVLAEVSTFGTLDDWGSDDEYNKTEVFLLGAKSVDRHALQLAGYYGDSLYGELELYDPFLLGGLLRGSGYRMDELIGKDVALLRAVYTYKAASLPPPLGRGIYIGGSLEATRATVGVDFSGNHEFRPSASIFVGADTFLGPAYLGWGQAFADDRPGAIYLLLGNP